MARFKELDRDHDGTRDCKEAAKAGISKAHFTRAEADKDGTLDQKEYLANVEQRFKATDPDNEGTLDEREFKTEAGKALLRMLKAPQSAAARW